MTGPGGPALSECPAWLTAVAGLSPVVDPVWARRPRQRPARPGAVLILFAPSPPSADPALDTRLVLIRRAHSLRAHAGQVAFPGGALDAGDSSPAAAAVREAGEEIGLDPRGVSVLTTWPAIDVPVSGYAVHPVLAWQDVPAPLGVRQPAEVAEVFEVTIRNLIEPAHRLRVRLPEGTMGPAFRVDDRLIWGFTGGVLDRLLDLAGLAEPWAETRVEDLPVGRP